jgi:8-oxo-dGTP pyrophosphatase MutT (NUDIX family)
VLLAAYVLLKKDDKVLLLKRSNTGYRDGFYTLPAGHAEGKEPVINAAIREAKEEAGVRVKPEDLRLIHTQHRVGEGSYHERINLYFEASRWQGTPLLGEPDKSSELLWADPAELPGKLVPELRYFFEGYSKNQPYGHFGFETLPG